MNRRNMNYHAMKYVVIPKSPIRSGGGYKLVHSDLFRQGIDGLANPAGMITPEVGFMALGKSVLYNTPGTPTDYKVHFSTDAREPAMERVSTSSFTYSDS